MMATLESVVGSKYVAAWKENTVDHPLAQFHAKYWGVIMKEEVTKWQESVQDEDMDFDIADDDNNKVDGDGASGEREGKTEDKGKGKEEEDEDEREGGGDDKVKIDSYIEGCYVLNINIKGIDSSIWVRAEYIRIFDYIAKLHGDLTSSKRIDERSYCVIITGQTGIGKTKFFQYAKRRCCAEKRPFVLYHAKHRYLVVQEGVFQAPSDFLFNDYQGFVWTLADADEDRGGVPEDLIARNTGHFVIYASSPAQSRWRRVHKTVRERVIVMNPWTKKEIHLAAPLRVDNPDFDHIDNIFDELGPIPRLCLDYGVDELSDYRDALSDALSMLTIKNLEDLVHAAKRLDMGASGLQNSAMDSISHKICLIRRLNPAHLGRKVEVLPITAIIGSRIASQLTNAERSEQIRLYKLLTALPEGKRMSGNVFEAYCQQRFRERISIEFAPLVRLEDSNAPKNKSRYLHQWYTSNTMLTPPSLEVSRKVALKKRTSLDIRPSSSFEFISSKRTGRKLKVISDVYYTPAAPNRDGFDSFIIHGGNLYLFQITNAITHGIKDFLGFFAQCTGCPARKNWRFIFVIPSDTETAMTCSVPATNALRELSLYSAEVAVTAK